MSSSDCWIAACALAHEQALLTHNAADYADVPGLRLITHASRS
jgi:predicted nucleic acid-binding protein